MTVPVRDRLVLEKLRCEIIFPAWLRSYSSNMHWRPGCLKPLTCCWQYNLTVTQFSKRNLLRLPPQLLFHFSIFKHFALKWCMVYSEMIKSVPQKYCDGRKGLISPQIHEGPLRGNSILCKNVHQFISFQVSSSFSPFLCESCYLSQAVLYVCMYCLSGDLESSWIT